MVLKNDLNSIRNDSPLSLTRNLLYRSSSTPCLSPTCNNIQQRDQSSPIEILRHSTSFAKTKQLVKEVVRAMKNGVDPIPAHGGLGGSYYFRNNRGENIVIVKPTDEEPFAPNNPKGLVGKALGQSGLKRSVRVGETGFREVAASYLLDHNNFANVPPTALVKITHSIFNVNEGVNGNKHQNQKLVSKIASFQQFMPNDFDASDHGTSSFPVSTVHRIGILDIRILNTDRHAGNLLVKKLDGTERFGKMELIPIDHGLCLPESLEDPYFEWIHWPQASIPFSNDELEYIENLDPLHDSEMLRTELPMIREACLRVLYLCTIFLKEAARYGLCLAEIGEMMSREFRSDEELPSQIEVICVDARMLVAEEMLAFKSELDFNNFRFDMDCEDGRVQDFTSKLLSKDFMMAGTPFHIGFSSGNDLSFLYKLGESTEEEESEGDEEKELTGVQARSENQTLSNLSMSLKYTMVRKKNPKFQKFLGSISCHGYLASSSVGHRSADEHNADSGTFVKLVDMNEEEWGLFLEKFQELLHPAFAERKSATLGQKQRLRLGTSCKF